MRLAGSGVITTSPRLHTLSKLVERVGRLATSSPVVIGPRGRDPIVNRLK